MPQHAILYTFKPSHYCEKARWGLDLCSITYREVAWAPGPHVLLSRRLAPGSSVPILRIREGCVQGSGAILDWLEARGETPWRTAAGDSETTEINSLEAQADAVTGVAVRRLAYATAFESAPEAMARDLLKDVGWGQKQLARIMWPKTREIMKRGMKTSRDDIPLARDEVDRALAELDERLADGRRYLVGGRMSRADITVASLIAPIAQPPDHPVYPGMAPVPLFDRIVGAWRDRPSVRWALALYRDLRRTDRARESQNGARSQVSPQSGGEQSPVAMGAVQK
jgi:glutathione S-transferase